jgi:hypothetical protein
MGERVMGLTPSGSPVYIVTHPAPDWRTATQPGTPSRIRGYTLLGESLAGDRHPDLLQPVSNPAVPNKPSYLLEFDCTPMQRFPAYPRPRSPYYKPRHNNRD